MVPVYDRRNGATAHRLVTYKAKKHLGPISKSGSLPSNLLTGGAAMANRRIEMYEYRQVIHRMRQGQSDRAIAKSKVMGRLKCASVRSIAEVYWY